MSLGLAGARGGVSFGNNSREFNGSSDFIEAGAFVSRSEISIAAWVKLDAGFSASEIFTCGTYYYPNKSFGFSVRRIYLGIQRFQFSIANTDYGHWQQTESNSWQHVAVCYGSGSLDFYLNGVTQFPGGAGGSFTRSIPESSNLYRIGNGSSSQYFPGKLADVREYNKVLSSGEVSDIYSGVDISSGLVGWWLTDTDDVLDHSGSGNNGTNYGSTYSTDGPFD